MAQMMIAGEKVSSNDTLEVRNPYTGELIDTIPAATAQDVDRALDAAVEGFHEMRKMSCGQRYEILMRAANLMREHRDELVDLVVAEACKVKVEAQTEIRRGIDVLELSAEESKRIGGKVEPTGYQPWGENRFAFWRYVPRGVVSAILPFNFPILLGMHKIGPALASGHSIICKPPQQTPLAILRVAELLWEAGLPKKAMSVITGRSSEIGDALITDDRIATITFTGSREVGERIRRKAGLKPVLLELGSNAAVIITPDCDLDKAAAAVARGGYGHAGQVCISTQRVIVQEEILDAFTEKLIACTKKVKVGNPADEGSTIPCLISEGEAKKVEAFIKGAVEQGATVATGGTRDGSKIEPTVLTNVTRDMDVFQDELFGPVVVLLPYKTIEESFEIVNDSSYGLNAGIFTDKIEIALKAMDEIEIGALLVNDIPGFRVDNMPYGGIKKSGTGREGVQYTIEEMCDKRMLIFTREGS